MKIFNTYLVKRSFYFSFSILIVFGILDSIFIFISELENISIQYNILKIFQFVLSSMPHRLIDFLDGACLLGVMISLGISHQEGNLNVLRSSGKSPLRIVFISSMGAFILSLSLVILDEVSFQKLYLNAKANKNISIESNISSKDINWIKYNESFLSFENIIEDKLYKVRFIKIANQQIDHYIKSDIVIFREDKIFFDKNSEIRSFKDNKNFNDYQAFEIPIQSKISLSNVNHLNLRNIQKYREMFSNSSLKKDIIFKRHLDKAFYEKTLLPFSILILIIYFGSLIFTSLRDSTLGSRIVVSVIGAFVYNLIQDLSIGIFISYGFSILIGVIIPSAILIILAIFSYKKI
ncbi:MAG: permease [Gammaproteobacteria bacterium]|nr:permease [Gammaproteobacteria bacterium]|tara:strand:+ start:1174 stop:2220 length:1047 start_codon:yes stop_codon:yes gene_type:complete